MFQFGGFPSATYLFSYGFMILHHVCSHIRISAAHSLFAAPRSFSQLVTSFIGSQCQGILHMLLFAWTTFLRCFVLVVLFFAFRIAMIIYILQWIVFLFASKNCFLPAIFWRIHFCMLSEKPDFLKIILPFTMSVMCIISYSVFNEHWFFSLQEHVCMFLCQALQLHKLSLVSL